MPPQATVAFRLPFVLLWWRILMFFGLPFAFLTLSGPLLHAERGLLLPLAGLVTSCVALTFFMKHLLTLRVTDGGFEGVLGKGLRWTEMETFQKPQAMAWLGGISIQSTYKPSVLIPDVIARDPAFIRAVRERAPDQHPVLAELERHASSGTKAG